MFVTIIIRLVYQSFCRFNGAEKLLEHYVISDSNMTFLLVNILVLDTAASSTTFDQRNECNEGNEYVATKVLMVVVSAIDFF